MTLSRRDILRSLTFGTAALATIGFAPAPTTAALRTFQANAGAGERLKLAIAWPANRAQRAVLARLDDTHAVIDGGVELLIWPGDLATLAEAGIRHRVTVEDLVARDLALDVAAPTAAPARVPGAIDNYADLDIIYAELEAIATANPDIATMVEQPHATLEGRTIRGIELGRGNTRDGRPVTYIDGVHHAREWPAAEYCRQFAHHLAENQDTPRISDLLDRVLVRIVPVVNADGFVYSRSHAGLATDNTNLGIVAGGQGAYVRKNQRITPVDEAYGEDLSAGTSPGGETDAHYGVDPNRNYSYLWGGTTGGLVSYSGPGAETLPVFASTSPNPTDQTYFGSAPFSEPCTQNTREFFLSHNVITYFSNHTSGQLMLRPWGHTDVPSPDDALLTEMGQSFSDAMRTPDGRYPSYENKIGLGLYATNGTSNDWAYAATGTLGYVVEHSTSFHPGYFSLHGPGTRSPQAMEQFTRLCEAALDPRATGVLTARFTTSEGTPLTGLEVRLTRTFVTPIQEAGPRGIGAITAGGIDGVEETQTLRLITDADGRIEWFLNPSTRPIVEAEGGTEAYELRVDDASDPLREVVIARGQTVDLGTIVKDALLSVIVN